MRRYGLVILLFTATALGTLPTAAQNLRIGLLSTDGCVAIDHEAVTGSDYGGIAVGTSHVFYTGNRGTGLFSLPDFAERFRQGLYESLTSNLRTGTVYSLGYGDTPLAFPGGTVTSLLEIDGESGRLTGKAVLLSHLIPTTRPTGIFAGWDRVVLQTNGRAYDIALPSGVVTDLGPLELPDARLCASWAFWGIAESFDRSVHLVYRDASGPRIVRTRVRDGETTTVAEFEAISDLCGLTVSPDGQRWFFHHENPSQFFFGAEVLGSCPAVVATGGGRADLTLGIDGSEEPLTVGMAATYTFQVRNAGPVAAAGTRLEGRLPATVELLSAEASQGGCRPGCRALVCELGSLPAGSAATVTVGVLPLRAGPIEVSGHVSSRRIDSARTGNADAHANVVVPGIARLFSTDRYSDLLRLLDAADGTTRASIRIHLPGATVEAGRGLAVHPVTGELWALLDLAGQDSHELVILEPETGEARSVGDPGGLFGALAFDGDGVLYGIQENDPGAVYTFDPTDGTPTFLLRLPVAAPSPFTFLNGRPIGIHPLTGLLYYPEDEDLLWEADLTTGTSVEVELTDRGTCSLTFNELFGAEAMTFLAGDTFLVADASWGFYRLSTDGFREVAGYLDHTAAGLAWADVAEADVTVGQSAQPEPATVGEPLTYTVTVESAGPAPADVRLFDPLPGTASLLEAVPSQGTCDPYGCGEISCSLGTLGAGDSATVEVRVRPWAAGTLVHEVSVPGLGDPSQEDSRSVHESLVEPAGPPRLLFSIDRSSGQLRTLEATTGRTLSSSAIALEDGVVTGGNGLAAHPETGELWALLELSGQEGRELVTIDPFTREARRVGDTGDHFAALAFDASGTLYAVTGRQSPQPNSLFVLGRDDATPTFVAALSDAESGGEALGFNPVNGRMYHAWGGTRQFMTTAGFETIDTTSLERRPIELCGPPVLEAAALTHLGGGVLLFADRSLRLRSVTAGGNLKLLGVLDHVSKGLAFVDDPRRPPNLRLEQRVDRDAVPLGQRLTYTLEVRNDGRSPAQDVVLSDALPAIASLVSATASQGRCSVEACGELTCTLGRLRPGRSATVEVVVSTFAPGTAVNTARLGAARHPELPGTETTAEATVRPRGERRTLLSIGNGPGSGIDGGNTGLHVIDPTDGTTRFFVEVTAEGATVEDAAGLATHPSTAELWALLRLAGRSGHELVVLDPVAGVARRVGDTGRAFRGLAFTGDGRLYTTTGNDATPPASLFELDPTDGSATLVLGLGDPLEPYRTLAWNPDDGFLYHAVAGFHLDRVVPGTSVSPVATACPITLRPLAMTHGGGDTLLLTHLGGSPTSSDLYRLTTSGGLHRLGSLDHFSRGLAFSGAAFSELAVHMSALPSPARVGEPLTYTLRVRNQGNATLADVYAVDRVPPTTSLVAADPSQGSCFVDTCTGEVTCRLGTLAPRARATVDLTVIPWTAGTLTNIVLVPALGDGDLTDNRVEMATRVRPNGEDRVLLSLGTEGKLRLVDPADGSTLASTSLVMAGGRVTGRYGLARHPGTGELWAVVRSPDTGDLFLGAFQPATGVVRRVGETDVGLSSLAFDAGGTLYGVHGDGLYVVDTGDGTLGRLVSSEVTAGPLAFHPASGRLVNVADGALLLVDPQTGAVTERSACPDLSYGWALTHLGDDTFLLADSNGLASLTIEGVVNRVGPIEGNPLGLAFAAPPPAADLVVEAAGPGGPVTVGEELLTTFRVTNRGPKTASGVAVLVEIDPTVRLSSLGTDRGSCVADPCGVLACDVGDLASAERATVTVRTVPWAAGQVLHHVTAPFFNDAQPEDNQAAVETSVLAASPTRRLLVLGGSPDPALRVVDPIDASTVESLPLEVSGEDLASGYGLAVHPLTGEVWSLLRYFDRDGYRLVTLDPSSGRVLRRIGDTDDSFTSLAFDAAGTLYALGVPDETALFVLSQDDATATRVLTFDDRTFDSALAFHPDDGRLYRLTDDYRLLAIDPTGLKVTEVPVCAGSLRRPRALTYLGGGTFLAADFDDYLYTVTGSGDVRRVGYLGDDPQALAFVDLPNADLAVAQTVSGPAAVGEALTYRWTVTHHGPDPVARVVAKDDLPAGFSLTAVTSSQGICAIEPCAGLFCDLGELGAGAQATVTVRGVPRLAGEAVHRVSVLRLHDTDPANNTSELATAIAPGSMRRSLLSIDDQGRLWELDPAEDTVGRSVDVVLPGRDVLAGAGLAAQASTGEVWALLRLGRQEGTELVTLDPVTGLATSVGDTGRNVASLTFDDAGVLYGVIPAEFSFDPAELVVLDPETAEATTVLGLPEGSGHTLAFLEDGLLYDASRDLVLTAIDPERLEVVSRTSCPGPLQRHTSAATGLGGDLLLLAADEDLFSLDTRGVATSVRRLGHSSRGLTFVDSLPSVDLSLVQADDPDPVRVGTRLTYSVGVRNNGSGTVEEVALFDTLPGAVRVLSIAPSQGRCSLDVCGSVSCLLGSLDAGGEATVDFTVRPLLAGTLTNTASAPRIGVDPESHRSVEETAVLPRADSPTLVSLDQEGRLRILNDDGTTRSVVAITLPGVALRFGFGLAVHPTTGELWALMAGESFVRELVAIDPVTVAVRHVGSVSDYFSGLAFDAEGTLYTVGGFGPVTLYTLSQADASTTEILTLTEGDDTSFHSVAFQPDEGRLYVVSADLTLRAVDVASAAVEVVAGCSSDGVTAMTWLSKEVFLLAEGARLSAVTTGGRLGPARELDHVSHGLALLDRVPSADLAVSWSGSGTAMAGRRETYTVTVANDGPGTVPGATLVAALPGTFGVVSVRPSQGSCHSEPCQAGMTCDLGALRAGTAATVTIEAVPWTPGPATATAGVRVLGDPDLADNEAAFEVRVQSEASEASRWLALTSFQLYALDVGTGTTLSSVPIVFEGVEINDPFSRIGPTFVEAEALAVHPETGELWALLRVSDGGGDELVKVSPATGVATSVGNTGDRFDDLAFDGSGTLYGLTGEDATVPDALHVLRLSDAVATPVLGLSGGGTIAFHPSSGRLYHAFGGFDFESVDVDSGERSPVATCPDLLFPTALTPLGGDTFLLAGSEFGFDATFYGLTTSGGLGTISSVGDDVRGLAPAHVPESDLGVTLTAEPAPAEVGGMLTLTLTVENGGAETTPAVALVNPLPTIVDLVSPGACSRAACDRIFCDFSDLAPGGNATVTFDVNPLLEGTVSFVARTPSLADVEPADNFTRLVVQLRPGKATRKLLSIDASSDQLFTVDPRSGSTLEAVTITLEGVSIVGGNGLAVHPTTGELWAIVRSESDRYVVTVDPDSGAATRIGVLDDLFAALAFSDDGTLYGVTGSSASTGNSLFVLDPEDGSATFVKRLSGFGGHALAFNPDDGLLYHVTRGELETVDRDTLALTPRPTCADNFGFQTTGMTHLGGGTMLVSVDGGLEAYTRGGNREPLGSLDHQSRGLAFVE